jgi:hypothetical protein
MRTILPHDDLKLFSTCPPSALADPQTAVHELEKAG